MVYHVYMMASASGVLYLGATSDLERRVAEHKTGVKLGFSSECKTVKLVYFEAFGDVREAIAREKQIKRWRREKKIWLIEVMNPEWKDLSAEFHKQGVHVVEIEERFLHCSSRRVRSEANAREKASAPSGRNDKYWKWVSRRVM